MILTFTLNEAEKWDKIVQSFKDYDVYYLSGYVKAFEEIGDGQAVLIYYENRDTRAINVVMKRDLSDFKPLSGYLKKEEWYDIVTPYGYGGFLVEGTDYKGLKEEYEEFALREHIVSEFVRFHPILNGWNKLQLLYDDMHLGDTVYIDTRNEESIWENLSSKNRNMIRKARKAGLSVYWTRDPKIVEPFMEIYNAAMDKDGAEEYYYFKKDFYQSILTDLKYNAMWFYSVMGEEIAAVSIFLFCNRKMHYHLSASRYDYLKYAPTNLLLYEAALWGSRNGYEILHLGGGVGARHDGLYRFKKSFNKKNDMEFHIGRKVFHGDMYKRLVQIREQREECGMDSSFFPKYRA